MVIVHHTIDQKKKEIYVELKGIFDSDNTYFIEKYEGEWPSDAQVENLLQTSFIRWVVLFRRFNAQYVEKLYQRKQLGFRHAD